MQFEKILHFEISHLQFSRKFKLIRHEKDLHFGEYLLMKNSETKRRVAVKTQPYQTKNQLQIILTDMSTLIELNECQNICPFIGYVLEESHNCFSINFIYDYHQSTLTQQTKSMTLHKEKFAQRSLIAFVRAGVSALSCLQGNNLNHMCLNTDYFLIENRGNIDMMFRLLITPFVLGSFEQINEYRTNVEDYNLSQIQLGQVKQKCETKFLSFSDKLRSDKQSLGLLALRLSTLHIESRIYEMNNKFQLTWNSSGLEERLQVMNKEYSKQLCIKIQYLIFQNIFHSFRDNILPELEVKDHSLYRSKVNSSRKLDTSFPIGRSRVSFSSKRSPEESRIKSNESKDKVKKVKWDSISHSKSTLRDNSPDNSKREKYENELRQIQDQILQKLRYQGLKCEDKGYGDGGRYVGSLMNEKRQGLGLFYFKEGDVYGGEWSNDQINGKGSYLFIVGQIYVGDVLKGMKHGFGRYKYTNGNVYEGQWKNDKKDGFGTFYLYNKGQTYQGNFKRGIKEGQGSYTWSNGDKFTGSFKNGMKSGHGTAFKSNGTVIKGDWKNDELAGIATINSRNGIQFTGQIKQRQINGIGTESSKDGFVYEGEYRNDKKNGQGKVVFPNEDYYQGNFKNGLFEGYGEYFYKHQNILYKGHWKAGLQQGQGNLQLKNGTIVQLKWMKGISQKNGKIKYFNGDIYEGEINGVGPNGKGMYKKITGELIKGEFRNGNFAE